MNARRELCIIALYLLCWTAWCAWILVEALS